MTIKHKKNIQGTYYPNDPAKLQKQDWNDDHVEINIHDHTSEEQGGIVVGIPGETGPAGPQGLPGAKGDTGERGLPGEAGAKGDPGIQGLPGNDGSTGAPGYTPIKGVDYFDGAKGDKGDTGDTGAPGYTPIKGVDYFDGAQGEQGIQGIQGIQGEPGSGAGYAINVQALTSSPADGATVYFGMLPKAPIATAGVSRVYIPKAGTIKVVSIWCYSGTAGTAESWSLYLRLNNTTDTLIKTLAVNTNARDFSNTALNITVNAGDYFEIKSVQPTWATNPATCIYGGYVYIE